MKATVFAFFACGIAAVLGQRFDAKQKYTEGHGGHKHHATTITCPGGYYLEGSKCTNKQEVAEELACPSGTIEDNGQCLDFSAGRYTCPNELVLVGKTCVGRSYTDKVSRCPAGSIPRGNDCVVIGECLPECPEDSTMENGRCARIIQKFKQCPEGYTTIGDLCAIRETAEPQRVCPTGTFDDNNLCKVTTTIDPVCPPGAEDVGSRCVAHRDEVERCPQTYRRTGSWCQKDETVDKTVECVNGANPADNCAQTVPIPLTPVCNVGKMWNGQCAQQRYTSASYQCPSEYQQQGSACIKTVAYDCSTTEHDVVCDEPAVGKGSHLRQLGPDYPKGKYHGAAYTNRHPLPVCHKVPRTVPKTCEKTITAQGEAYCSEGTLKAGNRCEVAFFTAPDTECSGKTGPNGECFVAETSAPLRSCPTGYLNNGSRCTRTYTVAPVWSCPLGTEGPDCAVYSEKVCPNNECETTYIERAKFICPEEFAKVKLTGKCVKVSFADKVLRCPIGADERDGLTCAEYLKQVIEDFVRRIASQRICPEGYADNGTNCVRREVQPANFVCPRNAAQNGSGCAVVVPKISACPKGATLLKDKCWVVSTTEPLTVDTVVAGKK